MKRWLLAFLALLAVTALPTQGSDIGKLHPVGLLFVSWKDGMICIETDTGDYGKGEDLRLALLDMEAASTGEIFLETTEYLVLTESVQAFLPQLQTTLRAGTKVFLGQIDNLEKAYAYLSTKREGVALMDWQKGMSLPKLLTAEGRFHIA